MDCFFCDSLHVFLHQLDILIFIKELFGEAISRVADTSGYGSAQMFDNTVVYGSAQVYGTAKIGGERVIGGFTVVTE